MKTLSDGRFVYTTPMAAGVRENLGPMARLVVDGIDIVVGSVRSQTYDVGPFVVNGIDPGRYKIVALKSSLHYRAAFGSMAAAMFTSDAPGLTTIRVEAFERQPSGLRAVVVAGDTVALQQFRS